MSSAAARAEARKAAIRARGSDRLSKLTTSARGEEASAYLDDRPLPSRSSGLKSFVGEETSMPTPPPPQQQQGAHFESGSTTSASADPSVWSEEQQMQFMRALMGAGLTGAAPAGGLPSLPSNPTASTSSAPPPLEDPMAAMLSALSQAQNQGPSQPGPSAAALKPKPPPSRLRALLPLLHILATWCLFAYFVLFREPQAYEAVGISGGLWRRWASLAGSNGVKSAKGLWSVHAVPFFWAFTTLEIILHSLRIFSGFDVSPPPMLLSLALPHLPAPLPSVILNGMKYFQMGGALLDDLAALLVAVGFLVWLATWFAP